MCAVLGDDGIAVVPSYPTGPSALADAAALGLSALAELLMRSKDGIAVVDAPGRWVYANPAACALFNRSLAELRGEDFLATVASRVHEASSGARPELLDLPESFICRLPDAEWEIICSTFAIDVEGRPHRVVVFQDLTGPTAAARTANALAQTAAQLVGTGTVEQILVDLARHGVEGTRALAVGTVIVGEDHKLTAAGGYGFPAQDESRTAWTSTSVTLEDLPASDALLTNKSVTLSNGRTLFEQSPRLQGFAASLEGLDWQGMVYVPLFWESHLIGVYGVYLPTGLTAPSSEELAFYVALADQSAVAVINDRLAASVERNRLARELHDSVSQALFSMTMHARAAQLSMAKAGIDDDTPTGRSVGQLVELTRGALAEMRALIFELRPGALAEEGLVAALRTKGAAITAREQLTVLVEGPEERLHLSTTVEEHLYRITSEALHNVVKHAGASRATVSVTIEADHLRVVVRDDGAGFDPTTDYAGHLGLSTMAERAVRIGANLTLDSEPGAGTTVTLSLPYVSRRDEVVVDDRRT